MGDDIIDTDDRVADELARPVIGDLAAAVGLDDFHPLHAVPVLAHRELARHRSPAPRVDRPVLEGQQHVRHPLVLARGPHPLLEHQPVPVLDGAEMADPELGKIAPGRAPVRRTRLRHRSTPRGDA